MNNSLEYIIQDEQLKLHYEPGKGSWTYHLKIPNTKHIKGKWGDIKVSGYIDDYKIKSKNLAPTKGEDKLLSVNAEIRKAINKSGGDFVKVSLQLLRSKEKLTQKQILVTLKESAVLGSFQQLSKEEQASKINDILSQKTEGTQIKMLIQLIDQLSLQ